MLLLLLVLISGLCSNSQHSDVSPLEEKPREQDTARVRHSVLRPLPAATAFAPNRAYVKDFDRNKLLLKRSSNAVKKEIIDSKTFTKRLELSGFYPCDHFDEQKKECVYLRAVGTTLTVGVQVKASERSEHNSLHWFRFFKMNDVSKTIYKQPLRRDALPWNINIGGDNTELRISPVTETDFSYNFFLASLGDPSPKDQQYIKFIIEPIPVDMGPVYQGEEIAISVRSFVELPRKSLHFEWSATHVKDGTRVPGHLPSNMRLTRDRSAVIIKEHRSFVDMTVTCGIYSSKAFFVARRSFFLRKTATLEKPEAQFRGYPQQFHRAKKSLDKAERNLEPDFQAVFVPNRQPFPDSPSYSGADLPSNSGKQVLKISFHPKHPEHKFHDTMGNNHEHPSTSQDEKSFRGSKGHKNPVRRQRVRKNKNSASVQTRRAIGYGAVSQPEGSRYSNQKEHRTQTAKSSLSRVSEIFRRKKLDSDRFDSENNRKSSRGHLLNRKRRSIGKQDDDRDSSSDGGSSIQSSSLSWMSNLDQYLSYALTDHTDYENQLHFIDMQNVGLPKSEERSPFGGFDQDQADEEGNKRYLSIYTEFQQFNLVNIISGKKTNALQKQAVGDPDSLHSLLLNEELVGTGYSSQVQMQNFRLKSIDIGTDYLDENDAKNPKSEAYVTDAKVHSVQEPISQFTPTSPTENSPYFDLPAEERDRDQKLEESLPKSTSMLPEPSTAEDSLNDDGYPSRSDGQDPEPETGLSRSPVRKKRSIDEFYSHPSLMRRYVALQTKESLKLQENGPRTKRSRATKRPISSWEDPRIQNFRDVQVDNQKTEEDPSYDYSIQSGVFSEVEVTETAVPELEASIEDEQRPMNFYSVRDLLPSNESDKLSFQPRDLQASKLNFLIKEANNIAEDVQDDNKLKKFQVISNDRLTFGDQESLLIHSCNDDSECGINADCFQVASGDTFCRCKHHYRGNGLFCWLL